MAKLLLFTDAESGETRAVQSQNVLLLADIAASPYGRSHFKVRKLSGTNNPLITASNTAAVLGSRMNAANTTDVNRIMIPVITDNSTGAVNASQSIMVDSIFEVREYPGSSSQSLIGVEDAVKTQVTYYRASRSVTQVVTSANA